MPDDAELMSEVAGDEAEPVAETAVEQPVEVPEEAPIGAEEPEADPVEEAVQGAPIAEPPCVMQPALDALYGWLGEFVHNSAASRDTAAYNRVYASVMDIRAVLASVKE